MKLGHSLELRLNQTLALTPQLQQAIRLLQMSSLELSQEIDAYLTENPLVEREDEEAHKIHADEANQNPDEHFFSDILPAEHAENAEKSFEETFENPIEINAPKEELQTHDDLWGEEGFPEGISYGQSGGSFEEDDENDRDFTHHKQQKPLLREHLLAQLAVLRLQKEEKQLLLFLIDCLDEDGFLSDSFEDLLEDFNRSVEDEDAIIFADELRIAIKRLQFFDPLGVGAKDTQECLRLQLNRLETSETQALAIKIVEQYLDVLSTRDFRKLRKLTNAKEADLFAADALIRAQNPRPCAVYKEEETRYVTPEVLVRKVRGKWQVFLNDATSPKLKIHALYASMIGKDKSHPLSSHLQEARWFIKNLTQRFDTILRVSQAIVDRQTAFLEDGAKAMRPLIMRDIAEVVELHESTISRVTTQKYIETPNGVFELKYFFGSSIENDDEEWSATAIRAMMKEIILAEPPKKPLSDNKIADILSRQGVVVARRTVAKYREAMNIPTVKFRRDANAN